jgi:hypothetical protein
LAHATAFEHVDPTTIGGTATSPHCVHRCVASFSISFGTDFVSPWTSGFFIQRSPSGVFGDHSESARDDDAHRSVSESDELRTAAADALTVRAPHRIARLTDECRIGHAVAQVDVSHCRSQRRPHAHSITAFDAWCDR